MQAVVLNVRYKQSRTPDEGLSSRSDVWPSANEFSRQNLMTLRNFSQILRLGLILFTTQEWDKKLSFGQNWLRIWAGVGHFEFGNEHTDCIKCGEFLDQLRTCQLLRKDWAPFSQLVSQLVGQTVCQFFWVVRFVSLLVSLFLSQFCQLVCLLVSQFVFSLLFCQFISLFVGWLVSQSVSWFVGQSVCQLVSQFCQVVRFVSLSLS